MSVGLAVALAACSSHDPHTVAKAADRALGTGVYGWLADHDPSAIVVVDLDPATVHAVAPDAKMSEAAGVSAGCRAALRGHALLAVRARRGTVARDVAQDCGFALFRDEATLVLAPR